MRAWAPQARAVFLGSHLLPRMAGAEILIYGKGLREIHVT